MRATTHVEGKPCARTLSPRCLQDAFELALRLVEHRLNEEEIHERETQQGHRAVEGRRSAGGGIVGRWRDGSVTYGGQLKSGDWIFMAVTEDGRGAYAVADTSRAAKVAVCDALGLSKATVIGGPFAAGGAEGESG